MSRLVRSRGFSLVELMVAMALGLVIVGGVVSVMLANKRSYRTNEGLSQIQESARTAYELIARDVRQSGTTGCDNARRMGNLLANASTVWWQAWEGVHGYGNSQTDSAVTTGTANYNRVSGTDSIRLRGIAGQGFPVQVHNATAGTIQLNNTTPTSLSATDSLMICDFDHSVMFTRVRLGWHDGHHLLQRHQQLFYRARISHQLRWSALAWSTPFSAMPGWGGWGPSISTLAETPRGGRSLFRLRLPGGRLVDQSARGSRGWSHATCRSSTASMAVTPLRRRQRSPRPTGPMSIRCSSRVTVDSSDTNVTTDATTNSGRIRRIFTYVITLRNRVA